MSNFTVFIFDKTPFLTIIHHDFLFLLFKKTLFWTIGFRFWFLIVQNACFCKIEIQTLILLTSTKLATKRYVKLFVDVNKSILGKQKNRKPKPAVKEHFRKFPFYLFNCNQAIWLNFKLWFIRHCSVWFDVVPACSVC